MQQRRPYFARRLGLLLLHPVGLFPQFARDYTNLLAMITNVCHFLAAALTTPPPQPPLQAFGSMKYQYYMAEARPARFDGTQTTTFKRRDDDDED